MIWLGLGLFLSPAVGFAVFLAVLHSFLRRNYVPYLVRIFQEVPLFVIPRGQPRPDAERKIDQRDVARVQEFRKCIECFLCQNVCHVLREHDQKEKFAGPRFFVRVAGLEMHPMDNASRAGLLREELDIGLCNITKCCTEVCPEEIHITDNAIIPLKERVVDEFYDPLLMLVRKIRGAR